MPVPLPSESTSDVPPRSFHHGRLRINRAHSFFAHMRAATLGRDAHAIRMGKSCYFQTGKVLGGVRAELPLQFGQIARDILTAPT